MSQIKLGEISLERMVRAVEKVRERLLRAAKALDTAAVPYAVAGGNAVAAWVSRIDEAAVRNTPGIDILLRRADLDRAITAMSADGFVYRNVATEHMFLDGPQATAREAVHIVFAGDKVRPEYILAAPDVAESEADDHFRLLNLDPLVQMKLTSLRMKDRVHLLDMLEIGLIDASWLAKLPSELAPRLKELIENPG